MCFFYNFVFLKFTKMILVSGATGLLGSHLIAELLQDSDVEIKALCRSFSDFSLLKKVLFRRNYREQQFKRIKWTEGDVMDIAILKKAMHDVDKVYHCAAVVSFDPNDKNSLMKINVEGTANMVNAALHCGVKQFCHVSSIASLGRADKDNRINEDCMWEESENNSIYSVSKYYGEMEVWNAYRRGLQTVIVNPSVILGAGSWHSGSSELFHTVAKGLPFYTNGVNGFVDVKDVARAMTLLMHEKYFDHVCGQRYILNGASLCYKELFAMMAKHLNVKAPYIHTTRFMSEIAWRLCRIYGKMTGTKPVITKETARAATNRNYYSSEKLTKQTDFKFTSIEDTINDICEIYKSETGNN